MYDNIPVMGTIDLERAPWNKKEELETITATKTYSFSYDVPVEIPEGLDDNYELEYYYTQQYSSLEEVFKYLKEKFKNPENRIEETIKLISENSVVDDSYIDFY